MRRRGLLARTERGVAALKTFREVGVEGEVYVHFYDATHPEARQFVWEQVRQGYYRHGIKTWWLDACEPELGPPDAENVRFHLGNGLALMNIYPLMNAQTFYEGMRAEGEEAFVSLSRSAWAGIQRYSTAVWSGDIQSTFEALQAQLRAGLNIGLSGVPWWTTDIGGFLGGDVNAPYFRELIVRWFQYGVFCPLFRLHGDRLLEGTDWWETGGPNEVWSFGEEAYGIIRELLFLRERLRPYVMDLMRQAHEAGTPPMRPLFYDFPADAACWEVEDQFMFGPDLLVAPVLFEGARSRRVYLPAGSDWRDAWTDEELTGGRWIEADAPLERIPLYLRAGKTLPIRA
jgi:alpha-D-xyloside xylohydrolase